MPTLRRPNKPDLHYELDDFTDPWRDAPVILLQHGYARSSRFFYNWVPYLSRFYKVVRPDMRGFGQSSREFDLQKDLNVAEYANDLEAIIDAVGAESVHYCGESLGGIVGMFFAAERPRRVRTLSLVCSPLYLSEGFRKRAAFGHESWEEALRKIGARGYADGRNAADRFAPDTDPELVRWYAEQQGSSDVEVMIAVQKLASTINATPQLSRIEAPVLGLYPSHGPVTTPEHEELLRKHVRNLKLVHLPSKYHNLNSTQPAACATEVLHFAAQHDGIACHER
jgi:3-oxoadipate enol-lactonase